MVAHRLLALLHGGVACSILAIGAVAATPACAAPPAGQNYKLVFADEFNGATLDTLKWVAQYPWGTTHNHQANSSPSALSFNGSTLTITATKTPSGGKPFTSGTISTGYDLFRFTHGYVEARIRQPSQAGSWPAFWMLDDGWPPEIDIMEFPIKDSSSLTRYKTNYHHQGGSIGTGPNHGNGSDLSSGFNNYGLEWTTDTLRFYLNGSVVRTFTNAGAVADMTSAYLILNYAVGDQNQWGGELPANLNGWSNTGNQMQIDWVRAWQKANTSGATVGWFSNRGSGSWNNGANWSGEVPKFQDYIARFGINNNSAVTVNWDYSRTVGGLEFDTDTRFTLGNTNASLQLARSNGLATINVAAGTSTFQSIHARLELYDNLSISNQSDQSLWLTGQIVGQGELRIDGPGRVVFNNNNAYTGDTIIDSGAAGPAVARVVRSQPFGTVGTVHLGPGGNATTARIDILDNRQVPNPITFYGRNNPSPGIQNLSGNNTFSGAISANVGGTHYIIQSDSGHLNLTGGAQGIALRSGTSSGVRTFTLQGNGNGSVTGSISDGIGTIAITKAGSGTWTLSGNNTYTGATTILGGTLALGAANRIPDVSNMIVGGGTFSTAGFSETLGTLNVTGNSGIDLGSGASILRFADSSAIAWSGDLTIDNWSGSPSGGGTDQVYFGSSSSALTGDQLSRIRFSGFGAGATILPSGEIVPIPEPASLALLGLGALGLIRRRRR